MEDFSFHGRKHIKRDYYNKTFSNPYFNKKAKSGKTFNTKLYIEVLTAVFLIYVIIFSSLFKVQAIEVQGTDMINPEEIRSLVDSDISHMKMLIFPGRNMLFVNSGKIKNEIATKYSLNKLEIIKGWQKLTIKVEEKAAYLIVSNGKAFFFIDAGGSITKELSADDLNKYRSKFPSLTLNKDIKVGDKPISDRAVNFTLELNQALISNNIKVRGYESPDVDQIFANTEAGWQARFNINLPLARSMENMMLVLNKKLVGKKINYIDLRFGDRVTFSPEK
ncbi:MAG: hypothetical protein WCT26_02110 [Candidatus Buchananbacteria bacterium]